MELFRRKKKTDEKKVDSKSAKISDDNKIIGKEGKKEKKEKKKSMKELYTEDKTAKIKPVPSAKLADTTGKKQSMQDLYRDSQASITGVKDGKKRKKEKKYRNAYKVLIKPLVTEKAANLGAENKYVFAVALEANKIEIAKAVGEVYGIKPLSVNVIKIRGKNVRYGRITGKRKDWKKAIITLPKGESIKVYEGV